MDYAKRRKHAIDFHEEPRQEHNDILKSFLRGYVLNTAILQADGKYRTVMGSQVVQIHPSSVLAGKQKYEAVMFEELVYTSKAYMRGVSRIQANWCQEISFFGQRSLG